MTTMIIMILGLFYFYYVCILVCALMHTLMCARQRYVAHVLRFP